MHYPKKNFENVVPAEQLFQLASETRNLKLGKEFY
jgi:hypothetical protein